MEHAEIEELLGAFALDAVDEEEAALVEAHLLECPRCRAEVASHRETVALLSRGEDAPAGVWDRIVAEMEETPPPIAMERFRAAAPPAAGRRLSISTRAAAVLAVAAVLLIALLSTQLVVSDRRIDRLATQAAESGIDRAIVAASVDPDARTISLISPDGAAEARVLLVKGRGYLVDSNLPDLEAGQTYQLWAKSGDVLLSVGVLGNHLERVGFALGVEPELLAITAEASPGVLSSSNQPVVVGQVPSRSA
ncbi:MAG: anti-sigma factor domain-containing protein [Acidimicrobiales bacterium]